ncbi:MAG TPA: response regulator [Caulobacteraceae bacterium]|jgi:FixJ family two-component response regulator
MPAHIVIVEDDRAVRAALAFALEAEGWRVSAFADPAVALARAAPAACLVVDFHLPGIDGLELIAAWGLREPRPPAVLITASPNASCRARAAAAGVVIVEKPLVNSELVQRVRDAVQPD